MSTAIEDMSAPRRGEAAVHPAAPGVRAAAWLAAVVCVAGIAASGILTALKHLSDFGCGHAFLSVCTTGEHISCERVLASDWSHFRGIPTSAFATAFYLTALLPSVKLARTIEPDRLTWRVLAAMALTAVATSIAMATYAGVVVGAFCTYCAFLYAISIAFASAVFWARPRRGAAAPNAGQHQGAVVLAMWSASVLVLTLAAQAVALDQLRASSFTLSGCYRTVERPPATMIRAGDASPSALIAEVVDPSCPHCRASFIKLKGMLTDRRWADSIGVLVYLYPRDGQAPCASPDFDATSRVALDNQACLAALAVQCAEQQQAGSGTLMLEKVFELQDTAPPWFTRVKVDRQAAALGLDTKRLTQCIDDDPVAAATVRGHVRWGVAAGVRDTPRLLVARARDGSLDVSRVAVMEGDKNTSLVARLVDESTSSREP